jgi:hypothetical protein
MKIRLQVPFRKRRFMPRPQSSAAGGAGYLRKSLAESARTAGYGDFQPSGDNYWRARHTRQG